MARDLWRENEEDIDQKAKGERTNNITNESPALCIAALLLRHRNEPGAHARCRPDLRKGLKHINLHDTNTKRGR